MPRGSEARPGRSRASRLGVAVLLGAVLIGAYLAPRGLASARIHTWSWYHYYLNAKYFDELGYFGLYEQTIVAQREDGGPLAEVATIRDLHGYQPVPASAELRRDPRFTDARWQDFKRDLAVLAPMLSVDTWRRVLLDRGYNPTPTSDALTRPVVNLIDVGNPMHRWLAKWFDVAGLLAMTALLWWAFGTPVAVFALLALFLFPPNVGRYFGGLIKYDWLLAIALVPVLLRRDRPRLAGVALGVATCLRVFPAVFVGAFVGRAIVRAYDERALPRRELHVLAGFAIAVVIGVGIGALPPGGFDRWRGFAEKIGEHNVEMSYGDGRVGLAHLFTHRPGAPAESLAQRRANLDAARPAILAAQAALIALLVLALRRRNEVDAFVLASIAMFALSVASHYYWSILALWPLLGCTGPPGSWRSWRRWAGPLLALAPSIVARLYARAQPNEYLRWIVVDACLLFGFVAVLVALIVTDVRAAGGWRRWLAPRGTAVISDP